LTRDEEVDEGIVQAAHIVLRLAEEKGLWDIETLTALAKAMRGMYELGVIDGWNDEKPEFVAVTIEEYDSLEELPSLGIQKPKKGSGELN
jgi:hypothetical protein